MSKKNNPLLIIGAVICLSVASTMTAFAGWEQTGATWKYNSNGTYFNNGWNWIDGNGDNVAECYYFNADGTILISTTTPDNFTVNENGAWVVNGEIQTKSVESQKNDELTYEDWKKIDDAISEHNRKEVEEWNKGMNWGSGDWDNTPTNDFGKWK